MKNKVSESLVIALLLCVAAVASVAETNTAIFGETKVQLSGDFVSALGNLGVAPGTVFPTRLKHGTVNFPIVAGAVDLTNAKRELIHSGGLTLTAGKTKVQLQSFTIDTTVAQPVITGIVSVNGKLLGRLPLFNLEFPSNLMLPLVPRGGWITLTEVGVKLSGTAAGALNSVFNVNAFTEGFNIGSANVWFYSIR
jgi:hypothetical protein